MKKYKVLRPKIEIVASDKQQSHWKNVATKATKSVILKHEQLLYSVYIGAANNCAKYLRMLPMNLRFPPDEKQCRGLNVAAQPPAKKRHQRGFFFSVATRH